MSENQSISAHFAWSALFPKLDTAKLRNSRHASSNELDLMLHCVPNLLAIARRRTDVAARLTCFRDLSTRTAWQTARWPTATLRGQLLQVAVGGSGWIRQHGVADADASRNVELRTNGGYLNQSAQARSCLWWILMGLDDLEGVLEGVECGLQLNHACFC